MRVGPGEAGGKGVDQEVAVVAGVEIDLAADRRHAEGIAVAADAGDDAGHQMPGLGMVRRAEAQRVHRRDRPRAHGEDVAQDAADAGRRALVGLDVGGVVVALHLEDHAVAVADVDDAGILARTLDDPRPGGRQRAQPFLRGFVRAVLVPHRREDAELGEARLAADQVEDALVFVGLQPVRGDEFRRDGHIIGRCHRRKWSIASFGRSTLLSAGCAALHAQKPQIKSGAFDRSTASACHRRAAFHEGAAQP